MADDGPSYSESEYLAWRVLKEVFAQGHNPISRTRFLKLTSIADRKLHDSRDRDIDLPRHWDKYGEVYDEHSDNRGFFNAPNSDIWDGQEIIPVGLDPDDFDVESDLRVDIDEIAQSTVEMFGGHSAEDLISYQYRHYAPNKFIQTYNKLRDDLKSDESIQGRLNTDLINVSTKEYIIYRLDEMQKYFPTQEYEEMHSLYLRWDDTMRLMVESDVNFNKLYNFLDSFVVHLRDTVLRFEHRHHIPHDRLLRWESELEVKKQEFFNLIEDEREALVRERGLSGELEGVSESFDETIVDDF